MIPWFKSTVTPGSMRLVALVLAALFAAGPLRPGTVGAASPPATTPGTPGPVEPARSRPRPDNEIIAFVHHWFALFDRDAPTAEFLDLLADDVRMTFPEATIRSHEDFRKWYEKVRVEYPSPEHHVRSVTLLPDEGDERRLELRVLWTVRDRAGSPVRFEARQRWTLEDRPGRDPRITTYTVTQAPLRVNAVCSLIRDFGQPAYGGFVTIPHHRVIENLAVAGRLHFVWIEAEHAGMSPADVERLVIAAENEGLVPIVRVPENRFDLIKTYVGTGVGGVVVPAIETVEDARRAVEALRYPPQGRRAAGAERGNRYLGQFDRALRTTNDEMLVVLMVETPAAVASIDEIVEVAGIDVLHIGPYDLSLAMGTTMGSPDLEQAVARVETAARSRGIALGGFAPDLETAREKAAKGYRFFTIPGDMQMIQRSVRDFFEEGGEPAER